MRRSRPWRSRFLAAAFAAAVASHALAAAPESGITVTGAGEAKAKPTLIEMSAVISADAELTADAMVKFSDAKKKSLGAIENLKLANLKIEPQGIAVNNAVDQQAQMRMMNGIMDNNAAGKSKTQVSEAVKLTVGDIEKMQPAEITELIMKVIDTGRDAGLSIGPPTPSNYYQMQIAMQSGQGNSLAMFKLANPDALRDQAYQAAMTEAKKKAERLATLAGARLGPVIAVQEGDSLENQQVNVYRYIYGNAGTSDNKGEPSSSTFGDIRLKVTLTVQFAIEK